MGSKCCRTQQNNKMNIYSTKALMNMPNFNGMDFYFSTENLTRLEGQCLICFSDRKLRLKRTNLSEILNQNQNRKLRECVDGYLENNHISFDKMYQDKQFADLAKIQKHISDASTDQNKGHEFLLIDIDLPAIKFTKLLVVLVQPWMGKTSIKRVLQQRLIKALTKIDQLGMKQVAVVQFHEELGIPTNVGAAIIARSLFTLSQHFKIATICCKTISDQLTYVSFFQNFKQQVTLSSYTKKSLEDSNYY